MENTALEEIRLKLEEYYETFHNKDWLKFAECLADNFKYFTDNAFTLDKSGNRDRTFYGSFLGKQPGRPWNFKLTTRN